jgi:hypothetical protein
LLNSFNHFQQAIVCKPNHITPLTEGNLDPPPMVCSDIFIKNEPKTFALENLLATTRAREAWDEVVIMNDWKH